MKYEVKESENARINLNLSYYLIGGWWHKAVIKSMR